MRVALIVGIAIACTAVARADNNKLSGVSDPQVSPQGKHLVYAELFGKAGAYGIGYEHAITPRLSLGMAASFVIVRGQQITTASPYLHARLAGRGKHSLFGELGAVLVYSRLPSPVPEWDGMDDAGGGGIAALGWQRATQHLVLRAQASILVGEGGIAPWGGFAIGFKL